MSESELYKELGILTKNKGRWKESISYLSFLLSHESEKIQAKALWLLGEIALEYPEDVKESIPVIVSFCDSEVPLLHQRAINALGRAGRAKFQLIEKYWTDLFDFALDDNPEVRLSFIWASENIAVNTPEIYEDHMSVFEKLLYDPDVRVRMEAPEIFRVLGKRKPEFVRPFREELQMISESDEDRVVRIHCQAAIRAMGSAL